MNISRAKKLKKGIKSCVKSLKMEYFMNLRRTNRGFVQDIIKENRDFVQIN